MRLRIVDYILSDGGGTRFIGQLVQALQKAGGVAEITLVSHGDALSRYRKLFSDHGINARFLDVPHAPRSVRGQIAGFYPVSTKVTEDCDVVWFPWLHGHRLPAGEKNNIVASFHDGIMFTEPKFLDAFALVAEEERETVRQWLASPSVMICSSQYWRTRLTDMFHLVAGRLQVAPLAGAHARAGAANISEETRWPWLASPYLLCPANTSPHKNHEVLLEGYARAGLDWPLVLTGAGADFLAHRPRKRLNRLLRPIAVLVGLRKPTRGGTLRRYALELGLKIGENLMPLGYVSGSDYDYILDHASALVMPTLGEGGGSFPVEEAVLAGIPVICSDIPILREQMARIGAEVLWFDPRDPADLTARLKQCRENYPAIAATARAQVARLSARGWDDVARDYLTIFQSAVRAQS